MGYDPRKLSKELLARAGVQRVASGRLRKNLCPSLEGYAWFWFPGPPPTTTHGDKVIKGNKLLNHPKLTAAWEWYLMRLRERSELVPLRPPYSFRAEFRWALPLDTNRWPDGADYGAPHMEKPDLDNSKKVLADVLELRGWLVDDSMIARDGGSHKRWCKPGELPGVMVYVRSLANGSDRGAPLYPLVDDPPATLLPAPWVEFQDFEMAMRNAAELYRARAPHMFPPKWPTGTNGHSQPVGEGVPVAYASLNRINNGNAPLHVIRPSVTKPGRATPRKGDRPMVAASPSPTPQNCSYCEPAKRKPANTRKG